MNAPARINGETPLDTSFMASNVRKLLRRVNGAKLTAREITEKLGHDAGPMFEPSGAMMNVIRICAQLVERGEAMVDYPTEEKRDMSYWIEPERCKVCGTYMHEHKAPFCDVR